MLKISTLTSRNLPKYEANGLYLCSFCYALPAYLKRNMTSPMSFLPKMNYFKGNRDLTQKKKKYIGKI